MNDIQAWLYQGKTLAENATEGPWYPWDRGVGWLIALSDSDDGEPRLPEGFRTDLGRGEDAEFIADARTRLPQALNALQAIHNLHQPVEFVGHSATWLRCTQGCPTWPCPTRQALPHL